MQRVLEVSGRFPVAAPLTPSFGVPQAGWQAGRAEWQAGMQAGGGMLHATNGHHGQHAGQASPPCDLASLVGRRCSGQVRSFRESWGFVVSPMFAGDIFVGTRSNPDLPRGLQPGDQIEFTVHATAGKSQAGFEAVHVNLQGHASASSAPPPWSAFGGHAAPHAAARDRSRSPMSGSRDPGQHVGSLLNGRIRSFKGTWGFVNSVSFDGDLFMGARSNPNLPAQILPDQAVQFEVALGAGGKLEAVNAILL